MKNSFSVEQGKHNQKFMLGDSSIGVFDSKTDDGHIGSKISILSGEFIRQFKLPLDQQKFYCYTSKPISSQAISNQTINEDPQNIFELLSMLKGIEMSLFDEYLNCIGNAFQVSQDRVGNMKSFDPDNE